jgi:hypothetical protein
MPAAASPSKALTEQQQQHSAGGSSTSSSSSSSSACKSPAVQGGQGAQQAKQQQPHPFGQIDAAGKELQGEFLVLHTTYSTDGGDSRASGSGAGSGSLRLNGLNSLNGLTSKTSEASTSSAQAGRGGDRTPKSARGAQRRTGVPHYKAMHEKWEAQQAAKKAANAKRATVPEVSATRCFGWLCTLGGSPLEQLNLAAKLRQSLLDSPPLLVSSRSALRALFCELKTRQGPSLAASLR